MSTASSHQSSLGEDLRSDSRKFILLQDSQAKSRRGVNSSKVKMKFKSKHEDQRVLKGSLWEQKESLSPNPSITSLGSGGSRISTRNLSLSSGIKKLELVSIEYDEVRLSCQDSQVKEISENQCRLLLAIPDSLERYKLYSETERFIACSYVNINSQVQINTRHHSSLLCIVKWMGRMSNRQGVWLGVEISVRPAQTRVIIVKWLYWWFWSSCVYIVWTKWNIFPEFAYTRLNLLVNYLLTWIPGVIVIDSVACWHD